MWLNGRADINIALEFFPYRNCNNRSNPFDLLTGKCAVVQVWFSFYHNNIVREIISRINFCESDTTNDNWIFNVNQQYSTVSTVNFSTTYVTQEDDIFFKNWDISQLTTFKNIPHSVKLLFGGSLAVIPVVPVIHDIYPQTPTYLSGPVQAFWCPLEMTP